MPSMAVVFNVGATVPLVRQFHELRGAHLLNYFLKSASSPA